MHHFHAHPNQDAHCDSHADSDADAYGNQHADYNTDLHFNSDADEHSDTDVNSDADADTHFNTNPGSQRLLPMQFFRQPSVCASPSQWNVPERLRSGLQR